MSATRNLMYSLMQRITVVTSRKMLCIKSINCLPYTATPRNLATTSGQCIHGTNINGGFNHFLSNCISFQNISTSKYSTNSNSSNGSTSSDGESTNSSSDTEYMSVEDIKSAVLDAALEYVHEVGWTEEAIAKGAESLGYSSMSHGLIEGGGGEVFLHLQQRCNEELEDVMKKWLEEGSNHPQSSNNWSVAVERALKYRLLMIVPYSNIWSQGVAKVSLSPSLLKRSVENITTMADSVCYYAGDRSTDFTWYTRRLSVLAVYKTAELCLIQDQSQDYQDTWQFLNRRVHQMQSLKHCVTNLDSVAADTAAVLKAAAVTGLNILGFNEQSRRAS